MLESPDARGWIVPRVQERPRLNKPPLIYWMQAGAAGTASGYWASGAAAPARDGPWMYRLPSLIGALVAAWGVWRLGNAMFAHPAGLLAGLMFAVSPIVAWEAHQARADMVLVAVTTLAMLALWSAAGRDRGPRRVVWLWLLVGVGIMVKGPVTPLVIVGGIIAMCAIERSWRPLRASGAATGIIIAAAVCLPWVVLVVREAGWDAYWGAVRDEVVGRSVSPREGHWGPPGYHTLLVPLLLWPGSMLLGPALVRLWKRRRAPAEGFLLAALLPSWFVFEIVATKLPHYTMPLYPLLAVASARALLGGERAWGRVVRSWWGRVVLGGWLLLGAGFWVGATAALGAAAQATGGRVAAAGAIGAGAGALILGLRAGFGMLWRGRAAGLQGLTLAGAGVAIVMIGASLPRIPSLWVSRAIAGILRDADATGRRPVAAVATHEDSLIYETRGRAQRVNPGDLHAFLDGHPGALVVVTPAQAAEHRLTVLGAASGFNYSKGRWIEAVVAERGP